jgi:hypothetical protein
MVHRRNLFAACKYSFDSTSTAPDTDEILAEELFLYFLHNFLLFLLSRGRRVRADCCWLRGKVCRKGGSGYSALFTVSCGPALTIVRKVALDVLLSVLLLVLLLPRLRLPLLPLALPRPAVIVACQQQPREPRPRKTSDSTATNLKRERRRCTKRHLNGSN